MELLFRLFFSLLIPTLLSGCQLLNLTTSPSFLPKEYTFPAPNEATWAAIQKTVEDYPVKYANYETGRFQSQEIPVEKIWKNPTGKANLNDSYTLTIQLIVSKDNKFTKVTILKKIHRDRGLGYKVIPVPSDGLEEEVLFYRIGRELYLAKMKSVKKKSK